MKFCSTLFAVGGSARDRVVQRMVASNHVCSLSSSSRLFCSSTSDKVPDSSRGLPIDTIESRFTGLDWSDRIGLQSKWTLEEKGWYVQVEYRETPFGAGVFAMEDIPANTILRKGILNRNLVEFQTIQDIEEFCQKDQKLLDYVADYMWGFDPKQEERGNVSNPSFFGMWVPGNGLNHSEMPNTVYRKTDKGINLVTIKDCRKGDELFDDYRRHGLAPKWLLEFAAKYEVSLNFSDCNDFVIPFPSQ